MDRAVGGSRRALPGPARPGGERGGGCDDGRRRAGRPVTARRAGRCRPAGPGAAARGDRRPGGQLIRDRAEPAGPGRPFARDAVTWLCYDALGAYTFWLYAFGPALALLRAQLHFPYIVVGVFGATWAAGAALAGAVFAWACRASGRRAVLWWCALAACGGAAMFVLPGPLWLAVAGAGALGVFGTLVQAVTQSVLSDHHGLSRDRALVECNVGAAGCAVAAPLVLGFLRTTPAGWRAGLALPACAFAVLFLAYRHLTLPGPAGRAGSREPVRPGNPAPGGAGGAGAGGPGENAARRAGLPLACWLFAWLVAVGIGVEFCVVYFGAELLTADAGLSAAAAASALAVFYAGLLAGRVAAAWLTRQPGRTAGLLWASLAVSAAGFGVCWLSGHAVTALPGLFATGLGVANLFPLSLALALAAAPGRTDTANARAQLLGGIVVFVSPLLLGALGDHVGLHAAFTMVPVLIAACAVLLLAGRAAGGRAAANTRRLPGRWPGRRRC